MTDYKEKFEKMRIAGRLAANTLDMLTENVKEGVSTDFIDKLGYEFIRDNGGHSAPLYYRGFTKSLCTSLNHVVCHGIPSDRILRDGDAINVDVTAIVDEHYGDTSRMFSVGKTSVKLNNLIDTTYESMMRAIKILKPGMTFTIEPMINSGKYDVKMLNDGWTAVTKDKSLSAQFEHTLGITENGYEIFTESAKGFSKPPYL